MKKPVTNAEGPSMYIGPEDFICIDVLMDGSEPSKDYLYEGSLRDEGVNSDKFNLIRR